MTFAPSSRPSAIADAWTKEAARLPLAFSQVREDPRLDLAVLRRVRSPADVVMIASGGDTAVCLAREPLRSLTLVDMNPAQLALCRLKLHLAGTASPTRSLELLGHRETDAGERKAELKRLCDDLELPDNVFGPAEVVAAHGPDRVGRYEVLFASLHEALKVGWEPIQAMLQMPLPQHNGSNGSQLGSVLDEALERVMGLPNLVALFGHEATQNPRQSFHRHFAERVRCGVTAHPPSENPFLWQMLAGSFPPGMRYDWFESEAPLQAAPHFVHGRMSDTLAVMPEESADFVHLSNILDWLSEAEATECLRRAARVLRFGGMVLLRQLNSTLVIPALDSGLRWDTVFGAELHAQDRSFFYHAIHVGMRP